MTDDFDGTPRHEADLLALTAAGITAAGHFVSTAVGCAGPLGVAHGWIGTGFYLWVLGRDPWLELFGQG